MKRKRNTEQKTAASKPIVLSDEEIRRLRLRAQRLHPQAEPGTSAAEVVYAVCGVQAQAPAAARLAVRARSRGLIDGDVERARVQGRSLTRTWGPRGTLHLLATADLSWLLPLFGPSFIAATSRRYAELGLDDEILGGGVRAIRAALANGDSLTRAELVERLAGQGIRLEGQARPALLRHAALQGVICLGPDRGAEPTYVLLDDWVERGPSLTSEAAHAELARRYLGAYGPATPEDQAAWSGLPMREIRAAWQHIAGELVEVEIDGDSAWMLKSSAAWLDEPPAPVPIVRLLPDFDTYLLGYRDRDLAVPRQHAKRINAGGGMLHPTVLVDGSAIGTWKSQRKKKHLDVVVEPFHQLDPAARAGLDAEVADVARFLGQQATLHVLPPRP